MSRDRRWAWGAAVVCVLAAAGIGGYVWARLSSGPAIPADALRVPEAYPTVASALAAARPGETISVDARRGPFAESVTVDVAGISIISRGGNALLRAERPEPALTIAADGVRLYGLSLASPVSGLRIEGASGSIVERVTVSGSPIGIELIDARDTRLDRIVVRGGGVGIELLRSAGTRIEAFEIRGTDATGIKLIDARANRIDGGSIVGASVGVSLESGSDENRLIGLRIEDGRIAGLEILGASGSVVVDPEIRACATGISFHGGTGNELRGGTIVGTTRSAVSLRDAAQHRVIGVTVRAASGDGIRVTDSAEAAITDSRVTGGAGIGIALEGGDRGLLLGNRIDGWRIGIEAAGATAGRILRNELSRNTIVAVLVRGGGGHLIADNRSAGSDDGIALIGSLDSRLVRNALTDHRRAGISLVAGAQRNAIVDCDVSACATGVLLEGALRTELRGGRIAGCRTGIHLVRSGLGTRIEGNRIARNGVGLLRTEAINAGASILDDVGGAIPIEPDGGSPIVENNWFSENVDFDVRNDSPDLLEIGGNWWGGADDGRAPERAAVSGGVRLPVSAWRGVVAVGTGRDPIGVLVGRILEWALRDAGFRVVALIGLETDELVLRALRAGDVDLVWWSAPDEDSMDGFVRRSIPAVRSWIVAIPASTAERLPEPTLSSWADSIGPGRAEIAVPERLSRETLAGVLAAYGLSDERVSIRWSRSPSEIEVSLKLGAVDAAIVDSLEETVTLSGSVALADDRAAFGAESPALLLRAGLPADAPAADRVLTAVADRMTTTALRGLVSRIRLLHRDASEVAREFLAREGAIGD